MGRLFGAPDAALNAYGVDVAEISRSRTVAAEAQAVWDVLADFGAISSWAGNVDHSCLLSPAAQGVGVGTTRRVQVGRDTLVERITDFEPPRTPGLRHRRPAPSVATGGQPMDADAGHQRHRSRPHHARSRSAATRCSRLAEHAVAPLTGQAVRHDARRTGRRSGGTSMTDRPDIVIVMTDEERAIPPYESARRAAPGGTGC